MFSVTLYLIGCNSHKTMTLTPVDSLGWQDDLNYSLGEVYEMEVSDNIVYCLDAKANKVKAFRTENLSFIDEYGSSGAGPGELSFPLSMAVSGDNLIVSDIALRKLQVYAKDKVLSNQRSIDFLVNLYSYKDRIYYNTNHLLKNSGIYLYNNDKDDVKLMELSELVKKSGLEETQFDKLDFAISENNIFILHKMPAKVFIAEIEGDLREIELEEPEFSFKDPLLMKIETYKDGFIVFGRALSNDKQLVNAIIHYNCDGSISKSWLLDIGQEEALFTGTYDSNYFYCWYFNGNLYKFRK